MFSLSSKRALVTGASGGIGSATARLLAARGAQVFLTGRNIDKLNALQKELGDKTQVYPCDLEDAEARTSLAKKLLAEHETLDILVNNAGQTQDGLALNMKAEAWRQVLEVNLTGVFHLTQQFLRPMLKQRWGRIVMVGSVVGFTGNKGQANYATSKAGLVGMVKSLALELASRSITVNCVAPGFVATAMTEGLSEQVRQQVLEQIPLGRYASSEDIAQAVLYFASLEAAYTTGQTLHVNGGLAMV